MMSKLVCFFGLLFLSVVCVDASHFRGAIFTWIPSEDGSAITVNFRISWRRSYSIYWCNDSTIENGDLIGGGSLVCSSGCNETIGSLEFECTDYSEIDDWSTGRNYINYTVTSMSFSFRFSSCCWIGTLLVGARGSWSVQATVDMSVRSDTGRINSSPTVEMPPILNFQYGCSYKIHLPVGDVDGDIIRCRWATGSTECADVCNGFVGALLDQNNCTITYTANKSIGLYPAALQVEDFASIISTTPLSSIPLQFIVRIYNGTDCDDIPEFAQPTPENNECFALDVGDNFNMTIKARGPQLFHRITTLSPVGMIRSSEIKSHDSTLHYVELNVTWTPFHSDAGKDHSFCFYVTDISGITSMMRCISLPVSVSGPTPLRVERVGLTNTWIIVIDQTFKRPSEPAYIKVFETSTNTEIMSVDASNSTDVLFDPVKRQIIVTFQYVFDTEEDYHVSIPSGLVEGYVSCGALSVPVEDPGFWKIEVDCGEHSIMNGAVLAPNGTDYPHSVTYICNTGYDLTGADNRTCTANGTWTENEPYCEPRDCGILEAPENGQMSCSNTTYRSECLISCSPGYYISGVNISFCSENGIWNNSGTECIIKDCGVLIAPDDGTIDISTTVYLSNVTYKCNPGFDRIGVSSRECLSNGSWSHEAPTCLIKDCGFLDDIDNGRVFLPVSTFGSVASYICSKGYHIVGDVTRICQADGTWDGEKPLCELTVCPEILPPQNGNVDYNSTLFEDEMIFSCDTGFTLFGEELVVCQKNGTWSDEGHNCSIKDCGQLLAPANGTVFMTSTTYLSTLEFRCNEGYDLLGERSLACRDDGFWNGTTPVCEIRECERLKAPDHGSLSSDGITFKSRATYSCDTGYYLVGNQSRTCLSDRNWTGSAPECLIKDCGFVGNLTNGEVSKGNTVYGSIITFTCDDGYEILGSNESKCLANGSWSDNPPQCKFTTATSSSSSLAYWISGGIIILLISASIITATVSRMRRNKWKSNYWVNSTEMDNIKRIDSWQNHNESGGTSSRQSDFWSYALRRSPVHLLRISNREA